MYEKIRTELNLIQSVKKSQKPLGCKPKINSELASKIKSLQDQNYTKTKIAKELNISRSTLYKCLNQQNEID